MDITTVLVSALTGSAGGVVFGKFMDMWGKKGDHKRELKKAFFEKRLETAEEMYIELTSTLTAMNHLRLLFIMMQDALGNTDMDELKRMTMDNLSLGLNKWREQAGTFASTGAYGLYFDEDENRQFMEKAAPIHLTNAGLGAVLNPIFQFDPAAYESKEVSERAY
jgi:hypothetical protein